MTGKHLSGKTIHAFLNHKIISLLDKMTKKYAPDFDRDLKKYQSVRKQALVTGSILIAATTAFGGYGVWSQNSLAAVFSMSCALKTMVAMEGFGRRLSMRRNFLSMYRNGQFGPKV
jgi:hypothetical protein